MEIKLLRLIFASAFYLIIVFTTNSLAFSSQTPGKGDYEMYNSKQAISTTDNKKDTDKLFASSLGNSRAPAHDTPASPCKCSKYNKIK